MSVSIDNHNIAYGSGGHIEPAAMGWTSGTNGALIFLFYVSGADLSVTSVTFYDAGGTPFSMDLVNSVVRSATVKLYAYSVSSLTGFSFGMSSYADVVINATSGGTGMLVFVTSSQSIAPVVADLVNSTFAAVDNSMGMPPLAVNPTATATGSCLTLLGYTDYDGTSGGGQSNLDDANGNSPDLRVDYLGWNAGGAQDFSYEVGSFGVSAWTEVIVSEGSVGASGPTFGGRLLPDQSAGVRIGGAGNGLLMLQGVNRRSTY